MPPDPPVKRTVVFVDGQNLFHAAREAFGYTYPNYDVRLLAERICAGRGWKLTQARFYTGIPDPGPGPRRGGRGDPRHRSGTEPLDQDRLRVPFEPNQSQPTRDRQDRLDQDRPCDL